MTTINTFFCCKSLTLSTLPSIILNSLCTHQLHEMSHSLTFGSTFRMFLRILTAASLLSESNVSPHQLPSRLHCDKRHWHTLAPYFPLRSLSLEICSRNPHRTPDTYIVVTRWSATSTQSKRLGTAEHTISGLLLQLPIRCDMKSSCSESRWSFTRLGKNW